MASTRWALIGDSCQSAREPLRSPDMSAWFPECSLAVHENTLETNQSIRCTHRRLLSYILHEGLPGETCVPNIYRKLFTTIRSCNVPHSLKFKSANFSVRYFGVIVTQFIDIVWTATMRGNSGSVMKRPPDSKPSPSWDLYRRELDT